ncbi:MAG: dATP/dGTP diphosphohydrolase domain-containing protein [Aeromonas veronii]
MSIDFSKAPEGATHYGQDHGEFYKDGGNGVPLCFDVDAGEWFVSFKHKNINELTLIPGFEPFVSVEDTPTIGSKHDSGKPLMGAVPPNALLAVARVLTFGAEKYGRDNWRQVESAETRYLDAALRHINAYQRGEAADPESGESPPAHAVCSLMFMLELQEGE